MIAERRSVGISTLAQYSARKPVTLIEFSCGFPQSLQANIGMVCENSGYFLLHHLESSYHFNVV